MPLSLDTETTGLDFFHGCRPFLVTTCDDDGTQRWWEWDVDPLTRAVTVPSADLAEINLTLRRITGWGKCQDTTVRERHTLVGHNIKFDAHALRRLGLELPWPQVRCTITAAHLVASNKLKDLTSLAVTWLGTDIQPLEDACEDAVKAARRVIQQARLRAKRGRKLATKPRPKEQPIRFDQKGKIIQSDLFGANGFEESEDPEDCPSPLAAWMIAEEDNPALPSVKGEAWKNDLWLPRALVKHLWESSPAGQAWTTRGSYLAGEGNGWEYRPPEVADGNHPWWTVTRDYANADSAVTVALWRVLKGELERRGLWAIYLERLRTLPALLDLETRGVTYLDNQATELKEVYREDSEAAGVLCKGIAAGYHVAGQDGTLQPFQLVLPKNGVNTSLRDFCFSHLNLPRVYNKEAKTAGPTLNKYAMEEYLVTLPARSKQLTFVEALLHKRKCDTALAYLESYDRFRLPVPYCAEEDAWYTRVFVLHPSFNATGTDTLRMSCQNPNGQQISKQEVECPHCEGGGCGRCHGTGRKRQSLRRAFGPAPGREYWSMDAKNIELRIPAYLSGERELIALFEESEAPPYYGSFHLLNFHTVFPDVWDRELRDVGLDKVGPFCKKKYASSHYQDTKNGGFCKQYGGGRAKTDATFRRAGAHDLLNTRFARLESTNQTAIRYAAKHGYIETLPDRTCDSKHGYPLLCTRSEEGRVLPTVPLNYKVQGTACWAVGTRMMNESADVLAQWRREGCDAWMILNVHDELVYDLPAAPVTTALKNGQLVSSNLSRMLDLKRQLETVGDDLVPRVPLVMGLEYHPVCWAEGVTCA